jgi:hypothetical protein
MRKLIIVLAILAVAVGVASARQSLYEPRAVPQQSRAWGFCFFDDLEPQPDPGWAHGDYTATATPHFHVDSYLAYAGQYSWWCGTFAYDADGGYGNSWDDRLTCPPAGWTGYLYPVLTFYFRGDSEPGYDYSYADAESSGAYVHLNRGYDGPHAWGSAGFYLGDKDDPAQCRFRFVSDGAWSDGDGLYPSNAGAFMCDDIMIWDYYTGTQFFYDDVESGGLCTPGVPPSAGDFWHTVQDECLAWSDPTVWVNTQTPDENFVPPGVQNWLRTPEVCIRDAVTCTTYWIQQFFTPTVDNFTHGGATSATRATLSATTSWVATTSRRSCRGSPATTSGCTTRPTTAPVRTSATTLASRSTTSRCSVMVARAPTRSRSRAGAV